MRRLRRRYYAADADASPLFFAIIFFADTPLYLYYYA